MTENEGIIDFGGNPLSTCAANLLYRLLGPLCNEGGKIFGFWSRQYRENIEQVAAERQKMGEERHLQAKNLRPVDPKVGTLWLTGAMLESDSALQKLWARLLTNAEDTNFKEEIRIAFIDIIKTLTPMEAAILNSAYKELCYRKLWDTPQCLDTIIVFNKATLIKEFNTDELSYAASLLNLERCQLITTLHPTGGISVNGKPSVHKGHPSLTALGVLFIEACINPHSNVSPH